MNKQLRLYHSINHGATAFCFALLMLVTACGGQDDPVVENENKLELSDKEIHLEIDGWKSMTESRASIFESKDDFLNEGSDLDHGGFKLYAYTRNSDTPFIDGTKVCYQKGSERWRFFAYPNYIEYYWPQTGTYDFFALMPYGDRQQNITEVEYDKTSGNVTLTCQMQSEVTLEDPDGQETIFAYTRGLDKKSGNVDMHFVHPFSAVNFKLVESYRDLRINLIQFENIHLNGSVTLTGKTEDDTTIEWKPTGESTGKFTISVNKTVGSDNDDDNDDKINYGEIGQTYLVRPQTFTGNERITISYTWNGVTDSFSRSIITDNVTGWLAGNKYLYKLSLGDSEGEIVFQVEVERWTSGGVKNEIDVE